MSEFSPTEAALEGLRISRERPVAVLWWWAAYACATVLNIALSSSPPLRRLNDMSASLDSAWRAAMANPPDSAAAQQYVSLLAGAAPSLALVAAVGLIIQLVLFTAVLRAVLRPAEHAFGYLRLTLDELRQVGLAIILWAAAFAYVFLAIVLCSLIVALLGGLAAPASGLSVLMFVAVGLASLYPAVRLSLAPAMTLADGRISVVRAWRLTQGRFWPLLGAYLIATVIGLALMTAVIILFKLVLRLLGSGAPPPIHGLEDLLRPVALLTVIVNGLLTALLGAIVAAPSASAFKQLTGRVGAGAPARPSAPGSPWG